MLRLTDGRLRHRAHCERIRSWRGHGNALRVSLFAAAVIVAVMIIMALSACGGSGAASDVPQGATLSGNWQFTMASPNAPTGTVYGLQGGFLLQANGSVTGQAVYSISNVQNDQAVVCNSGTATVSGSLSGQTVTLTVVAGTPSNNTTFALAGTLGSTAAGPTLTGDPTKSSSTVVTPSGTPSCDAAQPNLTWSAFFVPPLTGSITGSFHSAGPPQNNSAVGNQDFPVTGALTQGANIGASNATVTGTLTFMDPITGLSNYPCIPAGSVSVNGQISGNTVILQLIDLNGSNDGQIGIAASQAGLNGANLQPVILTPTTNGNVLHSMLGLAYQVTTKTCPLVGTAPGDLGFICLALNSTTACQEPITLGPAILTFPGQLLGTPATPQSITLANNSGTTLSNLALNFILNTDSPLFGSGVTDFNGLPSFAETDTCGAGGVTSQGQPFNLSAGQSCTAKVTFTPQEACPWLPYPSPPTISGAPPEWCPFPQTATLTVTGVNGPEDADRSFAVPISGLGLSAIQPSVPELDFGAEEQFSPPEASLPQTLSFTNIGGNPVQILGGPPCVDRWTRLANGLWSQAALALPRPLTTSSQIPGLQVANAVAANGGSEPQYTCDIDLGTSQPNFQISADTCSNALLYPQESCSVQITYVPQPNTPANSSGISSGGLDYFLELNTVQCASGVTTDCEIDSGRYPVELRSNGPSPLRMLPSAGLDFGNQAVGKKSAPMTVTLLNDPNLANPQAVTFVGKILVSGNYSESDDCPVTLAPGSSCTLTVTFKPGSVGFLPGKLTINYTPELFSGVGQTVYLRGTGQVGLGGGVATTVTLSSSPDPSQSGQTVTFTAIVSSSNGAPPDGEPVTFEDGSTKLGTGNLSGGIATFTTSMLTAGTHTITAAYGGDQNFSSSSASLTQTVN